MRIVQKHVSLIQSAIFLIVTVAGVQSSFSQPPPNTVSHSNKTTRIYFSISDEELEFVEGLTKNELKLKVGNRKPSISELRAVSGPVSVGFIFDVSSSVRSGIDSGRKAAIAMIQDGDPLNEYFAYAVHDKVDRLAGPLPAEEMKDLISASEYFARGHGRFTAFNDAVSEAVNELNKAKHDRRFLVIFSDGNDTRSKLSRSDIKDQLLQTDIVAYGMHIGDIDPFSGETFLSEFCKESGGSSVESRAIRRMAIRGNIPTSDEYLEFLFGSIMRSMNKQYLLEFEDDDSLFSKTDRKLDLSVDPSRETKNKYKQIRIRYRNRVPFAPADPNSKKK